MYALVQNGSVVKIGLPSSGTVNGSTVSNYNLLPEATLLAEGWKQYTENIPTYNPETQYATFGSYEILASGVIGHYTVAALPPTSDEVLSDLIALLVAQGVITNV